MRSKPGTDPRQTHSTNTGCTVANQLLHPDYNYDAERSICLVDMATFFHDFCWVLEDVALTSWPKGPVSVDPNRVVLGYTTTDPECGRPDGIHFRRRYFYLFREDVDTDGPYISDHRDDELFANPPGGAVDTASIRIGIPSFCATRQIFGDDEQSKPSSTSGLWVQ